MVFLKPRGDCIEWTESDRVLLIQAVIQVEEEIRHKSSMPMEPPTAWKMGKWDRIHSLLPQNLQGRSRSGTSKLSEYRCRGTFGNLRRFYLAQMSGKSFRLTKPVLEIMKKREDLLNAAALISVEPKHSLETSSSPDHVINIPNTRSTNRSQQRKSPARNGRFPSDHAHKRTQSALNESREGENGSSSISLSTTEGPDGQKRPASPTLSKSKDVEDLGKPSARPATHETRGQTSRRPPSAHASSARRTDSTTSMPNTPFEELLQGASIEPLRRVDAEFSRLSFWLADQLIPLGNEDCNQTTIAAIRSSKRRKLNVCPPTEPLKNLVDESLSRTIDLRIQTTFENLRVRFTQLLKQTSLEVAQMFKEDTPSVHGSPDCSHGVN